MFYLDAKREHGDTIYRNTACNLLPRVGFDLVHILLVSTNVPTRTTIKWKHVHNNEFLTCEVNMPVLSKTFQNPRAAIKALGERTFKTSALGSIWLQTQIR